MYDAIWATDELRLQQSMGPFRFAPGDRVECSMGGDDWMAGTVTQQYFREAMWPADRWMPYQVELEDGCKIYAPKDDDAVIRLAPGGASSSSSNGASNSSNNGAGSSNNRGKGKSKGGGKKRR